MPKMGSSRKNRRSDMSLAAREIEEARKVGIGQTRINQYLGGNEELRQHIIEWHQARDPEGTVADWVVENESPMAGPLMQRRADNHEALAELAALPPEQRSRWLSKLEGHLEAEMRIGAQLAGQQQQWNQGAACQQRPAADPSASRRRRLAGSRCLFARRPCRGRDLIRQGQTSYGETQP